jgi:hypothetical protein
VPGMNDKVFVGLKDGEKKNKNSKAIAFAEY